MRATYPLQLPEFLLMNFMPQQSFWIAALDSEVWIVPAQCARDCFVRSCQRYVLRERTGGGPNRTVFPLRFWATLSSGGANESRLDPGPAGARGGRLGTGVRTTVVTTSVRYDLTRKAMSGSRESAPFLRGESRMRVAFGHTANAVAVYAFLVHKPRRWNHEQPTGAPPCPHASRSLASSRAPDGPGVLALVVNTPPPVGQPP